MSSGNSTTPASKKMLWAGYILSALPVLLLLFSGVMKLAKPPDLVEGFNHLGIPDRLALGIGILEIACTILYIIPRTAILGAILVTAYMGGAVTTHLRIGEPFFMQVILGMLAWGGLYLRDARLRTLLPIKSQ